MKPFARGSRAGVASDAVGAALESTAKAAKPRSERLVCMMSGLQGWCTETYMLVRHYAFKEQRKFLKQDRKDSRNTRQASLHLMVCGKHHDNTDPGNGESTRTRGYHPRQAKGDATITQNAM